MGNQPTNICGQASSKMLPVGDNRGLGLGLELGSDILIV